MNAIKLYRVSAFLEGYGIPILPYFIKALIFLVFNSVVPPTAVIGRNSKFAYGAIGVVLHAKCIIGDKVIIGQGVTIGRQLDPDGVPVIGDNVYISAGARILGGITIGNNVIIGANSVVIRDVPPNSIVAGVPAKIIKTIDEDIYKLLKNVY
ncbi:MULTISPECIES: serine acetyltransferase [unclassified Pseudoalteromonas]|uniref:serine O-acetyltransferase n=1 Tax=unclassified Pseudoalteromonas TaxID=194690 RepID=UPI001108DB9B|nr:MULTISPECIES: serine acetyltransferase [unclassified Pseudoalteromonas]TMN77037.1 serine acetyltransferase [Pseudoalteromonas sp. S410]TMN87482.1 serine acetyltransferase [Pseudoalteromonas sp. S408]TMN94511.1 serine acetyltransferase [Pseudoalteromonas sp. S407]TMO01737.1 serine acetyltransferase [Pseudoalteromonas sp. S409]TMO10886.1 serine acetyltransferase [Pseudoalteromonas sp. S186]